MKKERRNWLFQLACALYRVLFYAFFGGRILGRRIDIPQGGFVVMSNHINLLDAVSVSIAVKGRELRFMGKAELFSNKLVGAVLRYVHAFPVQRGGMDLGAMRSSLRILKNGEGLGIFPEGTRSKDGEMLPLLAGAAVLALKSDAPVIPIWIAGRYRFWGRLRVVVGRPIAANDLREKGADRESTDLFLQRMERAFASLAVQAGDWR